MSSSEIGIIKDLKDAIKAPEKKKTQGYYTRATVKRIEGKTAWVHIPGGVDETPVSLTINAAPGDAVQVRVEGGRAWIVGNISAPPTDDKMANKALMYAQYLEKKMGKQVQEVQDDLDTLIENDIVAEIQRYCLANQNHIPAGQTFDNIKYSAWSDDVPEYVTGKYFWHRVKYVHKNGDITFSDPWFDGGLQVSAEARIAAGVAATAAETAQGIADQALGKAEGTEKYFWHDSSGAHVSDRSDHDLTQGNSQTISSNGTIIMRNGKLVTSWTGSSTSDAALNFYDCSNASARTGDLMASYTRAGIILYANNNQALSVTPSGMAVYKSDGSSTLASFTGSGISFADDVPFTIGNSNSYVKWVRENNVWKVKICADEIQMGGKDVMAGGVAVNDNLVNVGIWDSSFVSNVIGWEKESSATLTYDASTGLVTITAPNSNNWGLYQDITVKANTKYTISAKVGATYRIGFGTSTYPSDDGTGWQTASNGRVYKTFTTGSSTTYRIYVYAQGTSRPCIINNIKVEEGEAYTGWAPGNSSRYMTYVSSSYGVRVYSGAGRPNTYAQVNADGMTVVRSGTTYASFGSTCIIGSASYYNLQIASDSFIFKNASTTIGRILAYDFGGIALRAGNSDLTLFDTGASLMINSLKGINLSSVSNQVQIMGGLSLVLDNNCPLYGKTTGSTLSNMVVLNLDNNLVIGWDQYNSALGATGVCGNSVDLRGNSTINLMLIDRNNSWDRRIHFQRDSAGEFFFRPTTNNTIKLGSENFKWAKISAVDSNIGSDLKDKDVIEDFDWKVDEFISGLKPIAYRLNFHDGEEHHRIRLGFGAQDVSKLAHDINLGDMSMYQATIKGYNDKGEIEDIEYHGEPDIDDSMLTWTLSYNDFIAPIVVELQRLMARVDALERNSA